MCGRVHDLDGQEPHVGVAVEPGVELGGAERERRNRATRELGLARVRDLPGAVQVHEPRREHLGVDAVVAAVVGREQRHDGRRHTADAALQGAPVRDEPARVLRDLALDVGRGRVDEGERRPITGAR